MRICDWSSDVCSSDLAKGNIKIVPFVVELEHCKAGRRQDRQSVRRSQRIGVADDEVSHLRDRQRDKCEEDSSQLAAAYNETQYSAQRGPRGRAGKHAEPGAYTERQGEGGDRKRVG